MEKATILVVDDVPENITVLAEGLRDRHRVIAATNGQDAIDIAHKQPIDLILLDVMMPEVDGYEVCRRLKASLTTRDIPIIFLTALSDVQNEMLGLKLGAVDYLIKPCPKAIVTLRVQMHLESRNQNRALSRLVHERTRELEQTRAEIVRCLGRAAEYRDNETGMHVLRVSHTTRLLALAAGVSEKQADLLQTASVMHDVGKIGMPDRILTKPGPLDEEEWALMKTHPMIGADIIGSHPSSLMQMACVVALTHHEKWDGSGYPHGLRGEDIPLEGRIVAIADVFDALTHARPYKTAWPMSAALAYLQEQAGKAFDPRLIEHFVALLPEIGEIYRQYADTEATQTPHLTQVA